MVSLFLIVWWCVTLLWLAAGYQLLISRRVLRQTALDPAWYWGVATFVLWTLAWLAGGGTPAGVLDQLWYAGLLCLLASLVAVLGAKRPGVAVWTGFVVIPLLLVLGWPALFPWRSGWPPFALRLMTPAVWAVILVSVMGLGNAVGTRLFPAALCLAVAVGCSLWTLTGDPQRSVQDAALLRGIALLSASCAIVWPAWCVPWSDSQLPPWDRVWCDFVNTFGLVWARRLQDRFNDMSQRSHWPIVLDFYGLQWQTPADGTPVSPESPWTPAAVNHFRWLLQRFVDEEWIELRLELKPK